MDKEKFAFAETVAAVSESLFHDKRFDKLYEKFACTMEGIPGFWRLAVHMAEVIEESSKHLGIEWGENADFILTVENFVDTFYKKSLVDEEPWGLDDQRWLATMFKTKV